MQASSDRITPVVDDSDRSMDKDLEDVSKGGVHHFSFTQTEDASKALIKKRAISSVLAGGLGMMSDGYQNSLLSTSNVIFNQIYTSKVYTSDIKAQISNGLLVGIILGEAFFGLITDIVGRRFAVMMTTAFLVLGSILGTVAHASSPQGLFWFLTIARGVTGFGSGGEYPAAQTVAVEAADEQYNRTGRGWVFLLSTIGSLLFGQLMTYIVCLIGLAASKYNDTRTPDQLNKLEIVWRVEWAVGCILPLLVFTYRLRMGSASLIFQRNAIKKRTPYWLFIKRYWPRLLGSIGSFFFQQFISYPSGTFSGVIVASVNTDSSTISSIAWSFCLTCFTIPGLLSGAWCTRFLDRRVQLFIGFAGYCLLGIIIGAEYERVTKIIPLFIVLYGIYQSCGSFGPGNLNGLLVSEAYPTSMRGTAHGMIAALGKVCSSFGPESYGIADQLIGGITGTYCFTAVNGSLGTKYTFVVSGCIAVVGMLIAAFATPNTLAMSLEDVDEEWRVYLEQNGWTGMMGDEAHKTTLADNYVANQRAVEGK